MAEYGTALKNCSPMLFWSVGLKLLILKMRCWMKDPVVNSKHLNQKVEFITSFQISFPLLSCCLVTTICLLKNSVKTHLQLGSWSLQENVSPLAIATPANSSLNDLDTMNKRKAIWKVRISHKEGDVIFAAFKVLSTDTYHIMDMDRSLVDSGRSILPKQANLYQYYSIIFFSIFKRRKMSEITTSHKASVIVTSLWRSFRPTLIALWSISYWPK